jgi:hypothetical protein
MATRIRVDDIFKLSENFSLSDGVLIIPFAQKRKCKIKRVWTIEQQISCYPGNERLCPVSALLLYSTFAVFQRKENDEALFISSLGKKVSKATLARWVRDILLEAGIQAPAGSCRSASSSAAFLRSVPIDVILSSVGWSSDLVFFRHYHRFVGKRDTAANLLPVL